MLAGWRRHMIMEKLRARRHVRIGELAAAFRVSERTIRNDIVSLASIYPIYTPSIPRKDVERVAYILWTHTLQSRAG